MDRRIKRSLPIELRVPDVDAELGRPIPPVVVHGRCQPTEDKPLALTIPKAAAPVVLRTVRAWDRSLEGHRHRRVPRGPRQGARPPPLPAAGSLARVRTRSLS